MAGVTGRTIQAGFARATSWGTAASVTRQVMLNTTAGLEPKATLVDEEAFNMTFLKAADVGEYAAVSADVEMQLRYDDVDTWLAAAMGSATAPLLVSSAGANSLVAYGHGVTLATELWPMFTLALDLNVMVIEVPTFKVKGYTIRTGDGGKMVCTFPIVGQRGKTDSTTNVASTVKAARATVEGGRVMRRQGVVRMNVASAASLVAADELTLVKDITFNTTRGFAEDDYCFNQLGIIEPDENAYPEMSLELTYARMNTVTANSITAGLLAGQTFKADITFTGNSINANTNRSMKWEFPCLQVYDVRLEATGPDQVRPVGMFRAKAVNVSPFGMGPNSYHATSLTAPFRLTIINTNSQNLLV